MLSHPYGATSGDLDDAGDESLTPGSVPEGPVSAPPGPRIPETETDAAQSPAFSPPPTGEFFEEAAAQEEAEVAANIVDHLPVGVLVFDPDQNLRYSNRGHAGFIGRDLRKSGGMENWLRAGCRDPAYADDVIQAWREHIWQKQLNWVFSLKNADDQLREIEFRPRLLKNGDLLLTLLDVTESHQAEDALRATEAKYLAIFEQIEDGVALVDRTGRFLETNAAFASLLGYSRGELRRMALNDCVVFSDIERLRSAEAELEAEGGQSPEPTLSSRREFSGAEVIGLRPREGDAFAAEVSLSLMLGPEGQKLYTILFARKDARSDRLHEESETCNRALLEAIPDLILLLDSESRIVDLMPANGGGWRGIAASRDWVGRPVGACWPAFDAAAVAHVREAIESGEIRSWRFSEPMAGTDGEVDAERRVHYTARVAPCEGGAVVVVMDVTGEATAREVLVRQGLAFRHLEEAIILTNLRGRIVDWNAAAGSIFGYPLSEVAGQGLAMLYAGADTVEEFNAEVSRALTETGRWQSRRPFYRKDGSSGLAEVWFLPVEESGAPRSLLGIHRELTGASLESDADERAQHRWRNQLQLIGSLLSLELAEGAHTGVPLLLKVQARLKAVSRLHEFATSLGGPVMLTEFTRALAGDLMRMVGGPTMEGTPPQHAGASIEVLGDDDGGVEVDFETATTFGLLLTELFLATMTERAPGQKQAAQVALRRYEGHPLMLANVPSAAMTRLSAPILKCLTEQLRGSLRVNHRDGRADWQLRFPASR